MKQVKKCGQHGAPHVLPSWWVADMSSTIKDFDDSDDDAPPLVTTDPRSSTVGLLAVPLNTTYYHRRQN